MASPLFSALCPLSSGFCFLTSVICFHSGVGGRGRGESIFFEKGLAKQSRPSPFSPLKITNIPGDRLHDHPVLEKEGLLIF